MKKSTSFRVFGGVVLLFMVYLAGVMPMYSDGLVMLMVGFALVMELFVIPPIKKQEIEAENPKQQ